MEIRKIGSMYQGGVPLRPGADYKGHADIRLGSAVYDRELQWVDTGTMLVANRCICTGVSWDTLNHKGYIFGQPVYLDGQWYWCRSLKVGSREGEPNEWDALMDLNESEELWHCGGRFFWGQDTAAKDPLHRAVRGYSELRRWHHVSADKVSPDIGFRPVLEPLPPLPIDFGDWIGKKVKVYGPQGHFIQGKLESADEYDLVVSTDSPLPNNKWTPDWYRPHGKIVMANKDSIVYVRKSS